MLCHLSSVEAYGQTDFIIIQQLNQNVEENGEPKFK
jgi:hypothetical protein